MCRTLSGPIFCKLQLTCKSHKPPGKVKHRNLHTTPAWAFAGLARWIEHHCGFKISQLHHVLKGTPQFVDHLRELKPVKDSFMVRADVRDFYMSGETHQIAEGASAVFDVRFEQKLG